MRDLFSRIPSYFRGIFNDTVYRNLQRSWIGRAINAISFMMVIIVLALWTTFFVILRDSLAVSSLPSGVLMALNCFAFFGGLVCAIIIGGWFGNALRRIFWRLLIKLGK